MTIINKTALPTFLGLGFNKNIIFAISTLITQQVSAHVEYFDLNQFKQISDLTAAGKAASTAYYGQTPAAVLALENTPANGVGNLSEQSDLPLNDPTFWTSTYQVFTKVGTFTNTSYDHATGYGTATVDINSVTDWGWGFGTTPLLSETHKLDFFNFRLAQPARVTITWNVDDGVGNWYDNGFSLYKGFLSYQGHDQASAEPINPKTGPFTKVQDALDGLNAPVDVQGIASAYRNTTATGPGDDYYGHFNALANWGQSNEAGNWSNVQYINHANVKVSSTGYSANPSDTLENLTMDLPAGNYTIAASGALGGSGVGTFGKSGLHGRLTFTAIAVSCP